MIRLKHCAVEYTDAGCTVRFNDGATIDAIPHPNIPHYYVVAHRLGYGDDIMAYCREHEVFHAIVAEFFYGGPSKHDWASDVFEEIATQTLQRFVRANERPIVADVDWDALKRRALEVLA